MAFFGEYCIATFFTRPSIFPTFCEVRPGLRNTACSPGKRPPETAPQSCAPASSAFPCGNEGKTTFAFASPREDLGYAAQSDRARENRRKASRPALPLADRAGYLQHLHSSGKSAPWIKKRIDAWYYASRAKRFRICCRVTPRTSIRFTRLRSPLRILTADRDVFKSSARKFERATHSLVFHGWSSEPHL